MSFTDTDDVDARRSCTRKKGYPSEKVARLSVASIREVSPSAEVRVYACRHCGLWHVGGTPYGERRVREFEDADDLPAADYRSSRRDRRPRRSRSGARQYSRGARPPRDQE